MSKSKIEIIELTSNANDGNAMDRRYVEFTKNTRTCKHCGNIIKTYGDPYKNYFLGKEIKCDNCNKKVNYFTDKSENFTHYFFEPISREQGLNSTRGIIEIYDEEFLEINLDQFKIPEHSKVISLNYTVQMDIIEPEKPSHFIMPLEIHNNSPKIVRNYRERTINIYLARNWGNNTEKNIKEKIKLNVTIYWIKESLSPFKSSLIEGFSLFAEGEYVKCILPAVISLENRLDDFLITNFMNKFTTKKNFSELLYDSSFDKKLKYLFPILIGTKDTQYKYVPNEILIEIKNLRNLRNEIAHKGSTKNQLVEKSLKRSLISIHMMHIYLDLLEEEYQS